MNILPTSGATLVQIPLCSCFDPNGRILQIAGSQSFEIKCVLAGFKFRFAQFANSSSSRSHISWCYQSCPLPKTQIHWSARDKTNSMLKKSIQLLEMPYEILQFFLINCFGFLILVNAVYCTGDPKLKAVTAEDTQSLRCSHQDPTVHKTRNLTK